MHLTTALTPCTPYTIIVADVLPLAMQVSLGLDHPVSYTFNYLPNTFAPAPPPPPASPPPPPCPSGEELSEGWGHHHHGGGGRKKCPKHPWEDEQIPGHRRSLQQNLIGGAVQLLNDTTVWVNNRLQVRARTWAESNEPSLVCRLP